MKGCNTKFVGAIQLMSTVVFGLLSPPIGWLIGITPLRGGHKLDSLGVLVSTLTLFFSAAFAGIAYSSRRKFDQSDDFSHYYENFQSILSGQDALFAYGSGLEVGLPLINYLFAAIFGDLSPWQLMFAHQFILYGLLIVALQKLSIDSIPRTMFISFVLLAFPYMLSTQLMRQCYSSIFLLWALNEVKTHRYIPALAIAVIFHTSALPLFVLFSVVKNIKGWWFFGFLIILVFVTLGFNDIARFALAVERFAGQEKLPYYADTPEGFVTSDFYPLVTFFFILLMFTLVKIKNNNWRLDVSERIIVAAFVFALAALPIPLMGLRVNLMIYLFSGAYLIKAAWELSPRVVWSLFVLLVIFQIRNMLFSSDTGSFALWVEFPSWGYFPGYYFLK